MLHLLQIAVGACRRGNTNTAGSSKHNRPAGSAITGDLRVVTLTLAGCLCVVTGWTDTTVVGTCVVYPALG